MRTTLEPLIKKFMPFAQKKMGFNKPAKILFRDDADNAKDPLGKTAYYDPDGMSITLYVTDRHPKDVMRSLSHELVHHTQNCNGQFENTGEMGEGYAQKDEHLREMEREAYEQGNLIFRDWEDGIKNTIYYESLQGVNKKMSIKDWKNRELNGLLMERFGLKFSALEEDEEEEKELEENAGVGDPGWAPEWRTSSPGHEDVVSTEDLFKLMDAGYGPDDLRGLNYSNLTPEMASLLGRDSMEEVVGGVTDTTKKKRRKPHKRTPVPEEEEELDEGGAAARTGNEDKDVGRDRMHADRVHEGEEPEEELEERRGRGRADPRIQRGIPDPRARPLEEEEEEETTELSKAQIREVLRKVIAIVSSTKGK